MEQHRTQEHIATLCAAGTLGIAATGFALASQQYNNDAEAAANDNRSTTEAIKTPNSTVPNQQSHLDPSTASITAAMKDGSNPPSRPVSFFGNQRLRNLRPGTATGSDTSGSRGSSLNRGLSFRPRTADTRSTSEKRDPSTGSSWLKRISTISTTTDSSPAASIGQYDERSFSDSYTQSGMDRSMLSNKLVKRSTSHRALPEAHSKKTFLRRPATSHQRSITMREYENRRQIEQLTVNMNPTTPNFLQGNRAVPSWRPYFEQSYPKKRHSMGTLNEGSSLRTIPTSQQRKPTLILGSLVDHSDPHETPSGDQRRSVSTGGPSSSGRHRLRRSLSSIPRLSRRRNFTSPASKDTLDTPVNLTSSPVGPSPISPLSTFSAFDVDLPSESPVFHSSPPFISTKARFSFRKKDHNTQSDPTTHSSDNDTRVFSDDDSTGYQSDNAFDSLATRGTVYSQQTVEAPKIDELFTQQTAAETESRDISLANLMQKTSITTWEARSSGSVHQMSGENAVDTGSRKAADERASSKDKESLLTPVKKAKRTSNDAAITPILQKIKNPFSLTSSDGLDDINWSPQSEVGRLSGSGNALRSGESDMSMTEHASPSPNSVIADVINPPGSGQRLSIFDWSENQRASEFSKSPDVRPKTVHGKQPHESMRSRSLGRKAQNQLHLRSQSVPNNREHQIEPPHSAASKFGTWGLGHKPVSEEWSDDFEFDDLEETAEVESLAGTESSHLDNRGSMRGVKVPQSIMDRQASVHVQFGQVQEFMLLVEELKRLRARAFILDLLDNHSKALWDDAESIINLATINDDDEDFALVRPRTTSANDIFMEETVLSSSVQNPHALTSAARETGHQAPRRSISGSGSVSTTRPRGNSLAQAKSFLQTIHQNRGGFDSSPDHVNGQPMQKVPFNTQDLKDLVVRSGVITRALKDIVRKAEGVSVSPTRQTQKPRDPAFSDIFRALEESPSPAYQRPYLPSDSATQSQLMNQWPQPRALAACRTEEC